MSKQKITSKNASTLIEHYMSTQPEATMRARAAYWYMVHDWCLQNGLKRDHTKPYIFEVFEFLEERFNLKEEWESQSDLRVAKYEYRCVIEYFDFETDEKINLITKEGGWRVISFSPIHGPVSQSLRVLFVLERKIS